MFEQPGQSADPGASSLANDVATAPGDIPYRDVITRERVQSGQFRHDNTITPLAPRPDEPVIVEARSGEKLPMVQATVFYTTDGRVPELTDAAVEMERAGTIWSPHASFVTYWQASIPAQPAGTLVRYKIGGWLVQEAGQNGEAPDMWAQDGQGFWYRQPNLQGITVFSYLSEDPAPVLPAWTQDAVVYQIFLDRFHSGTPDGHFAPADYKEIHGGNLTGVRRALPYLSDLGINCIWLSPVCEAPSYHRYDATDFYKLDPVLGTDEDMHDLVQEAHSRGIRVILDFVPSHSSWKHPAFLMAQQDKNAPSYSWYTFDEWPDRYRNFLEVVPSLPSFNTNDPGARDYIIGSALHWIRQFDVDGFRIDHVIGPSMDFWTALRQTTEAVRPDALLVGEATDTPDNLRRYRGRLHAILDFPVAKALRHTFALRNWDVARLATYLDGYAEFMATGPGQLSFLDNHDMNRFLYLAGNDTNRLKLAALCQFTLEATPIIYYGTEIGMTQEHPTESPGFGGDAQARADMPWNPAEWDQDLLTFYRKLTKLRHDQVALRHGERRTVYLNGETGVLGYVRTDAETPANDLLVLINNGEESQTIKLHDVVRGATSNLFQTDGGSVNVQQSDQVTEVTLPAWTGVVLGVAQPAS